ncbi:MAG: sialate O-acetylesterase [Cytophagales bacterium]|nr:sialate O-acetylesterase [Cytophagales bacterium]
MKRLFLILLAGFFVTSCASLRHRREQRAVQQAKEKFHVYLLMGQSNMAGRGRVEPQDTITHPHVFVLNNDAAWVRAKDPLHADKPKVAGVGLGLTFGKFMAEHDKGITVGLIPCAKGGSSIDQWIMGGYHEQTKSYPYDEAIYKAKLGMEKGVIKGVLWHQGESDCKSVDGIKAYRQKFSDLVERIENDLGLADLPFVIGELGYFFYDKRPHAKEMNRLFEKMANENDRIGLVKAQGLTDKGDGTHFDSGSYRLLGRRYAERMVELQKSRKAEN